MTNRDNTATVQGWAKKEDEVVQIAIEIVEGRHLQRETQQLHSLLNYMILILFSNEQS